MVDFSLIQKYLSGQFVLGISYYQIILCFVIVLLTFIAAKVFKIAADKTIHKLTRKTKTDVDNKLMEGLEPPAIWLIYICGVYWAIMTLNPANEPFPLNDILQATIETLIAGIITWACFIVTDILTETLITYLRVRAQKDAEKTGEKYEEPLLNQFLPLFKRAFKVALVIIALIIIIQNRGYSVSSLIAGFGITGLAIGFAAKDSIANIFGSITVMLDRVYKIGDWIIVSKTVGGNDVEGIVEDISLRSTKIRAFDRTLLILPNSEIANAVVKNVSRHDRRRIYCNLDIEYNTPPDKVEKAVQACRDIVTNHPGMYPYQEIHFVEFSPYSLKIMLYLFTKTTDWHDFMVIRQEVFLLIMKEFENLGVRFAYPSQTLYLNSDTPLEYKNLPNFAENQ